MKITICDICGKEGANIDINCFTLLMADETDSFYFSNTHGRYAAEICEDCQDAIQNLINEKRSKRLEEKKTKRETNLRDCPICYTYCDTYSKGGKTMEHRVKVNCRNDNCLWNICGSCTNPDSITIDEELKCEEYEEMPEEKE